MSGLLVGLARKSTQNLVSVIHLDSSELDICEDEDSHCFDGQRTGWPRPVEVPDSRLTRPKGYLQSEAPRTCRCPICVPRQHPRRTVAGIAFRDDAVTFRNLAM